MCFGVLNPRDKAFEGILDPPRTDFSNLILSKIFFCKFFKFLCLKTGGFDFGMECRAMQNLKAARFF